MEWGGRYSPDGERIAFISNRTGSDELWMANSDGTNPVQLTHLRTRLDDVSWAPNGKSIAVSTVSGKAFLVSVEAQGLRLVFDGLPFTDERVPNIAFSRNGNFLYVLSQPGTGDNYELLKVPIAGGNPARVMDGRLSNFVESMDGTTLFYSRAGGIWKRPVEGDAEQFVVSTSGLWDLRSDGLYLLTNSSSIERYSLDGKRMQTIAQLGHFGVKFPMSISPDARWALFGYEQRQTVEIDMVQGFN
jgi:Tol biopolymer transport system component